MNRFTGDRSIGPFWKLLEVAEQVGWCVEVPGFYDHDGCWISLLDTTEGILRGVAEEAWSQFVAKEISKRKDFEDLRGIDLAVFRQSQRRLDGKTRAFLQPIQDGSFLDSKAQSKFDMIWSDSAYATSGLLRLLQGGEDIPDDAGEDLWTEIQ